MHFFYNDYFFFKVTLYLQHKEFSPWRWNPKCVETNLRETAPQTVGFNSAQNHQSLRWKAKKLITCQKKMTSSSSLAGWAGGPWHKPKEKVFFFLDASVSLSSEGVRRGLLACLLFLGLLWNHQFTFTPDRHSALLSFLPSFAYSFLATSF